MWKGTAAILKPNPTSSRAAPIVSSSTLPPPLEAALTIALSEVEAVAPKISAMPYTTKPVENAPSPFSQRTAASFNRHFPGDWPYLALPGMRKEMGSSNWVSPPSRSKRDFPRNVKNL